MTHPPPSRHVSLDEMAELMYPAEKWIARSFYVFATIAILIMFYHLVRESLTYIDFIPINGQYQNFNPLRRLAMGQRMGVDFMSYLGFGPIFAAYPIFRLLGGDPAAANAAHHITHFIAFVASTIFLCRLARFPWVASLAMTIATLSTGLSTMAKESVIVFSALLAPDMTVYGMRVFWPSLAAMIIFAAQSWGPLARPDRLKSFGMAALVGIVAGISPMWSNDYGLPTAIALTGYALIVICDWKRPLTAVLQFGFFLVVMIAAFAALIALLTGGNPSYWIDVNFKRIAIDQFWYYGLSAEGKYFSLLPVLDSIDFIARTGLCVMLIMAVRWFFVRDGKTALFLMVGAACFGGAVLSSMGGNYDAKYYTGFIRYTLILVPFAVAVIFLDVLRALRRNSGAASAEDIPPVVKLAIMHAGGLLIIVYSIYFSIGTPGGDGLLNGYRLTYGRPNTKAEMIKIDALGGWVGGYYQPMVQLAERLNREFDRDNVPADQRLFSTYTTALDVITGARNPSKDDYIIHALGESGRKEYLEAFNRAKTRYAMTIRESAIGWEHWSQRVNWYFYSQLFLNYKPVETAFYLTLWKRRDTPLQPDGREIPCVIAPQSNGINRNQLIVSGDVPPGGQAGEEYWVQIKIDWNIDLKKGPTPLFGSRAVVIIDEVRSASRGALSARSYGANALSTGWIFPIEHRFGQPSTIALESFPRERTNFKISKCTATIYVKADETRPPDYKNPPGSVVTYNLDGTPEGGSGQWVNTEISTSRAFLAIVLRNPGAVRRIRSGAILKTDACVGERRVVDTDWNFIALDGPQLTESCMKKARTLQITAAEDDGSLIQSYRAQHRLIYAAYQSCFAELPPVDQPNRETCIERIAKQFK